MKKEAKKAKQVFLASDPDREGEAISWHLAHILNLDEKEKNRVVFNEITKDAVKNAFKEPRQIDMDLVDRSRLAEFWIAWLVIPFSYSLEESQKRFVSWSGAVCRPQADYRPGK